MCEKLPREMASFSGMADALTIAQAEESKTVRILDKIIRSFSMCPLDIGTVSVPALSVLEGARLIDGYREPVFIARAATARTGGVRAAGPVGFAVPLKILCGAAANLECVPTRALRAAR
jgi:hypothetical protein